MGCAFLFLFLLWAARPFLNNIFSFLLQAWLKCYLLLFQKDNYNCWSLLFTVTILINVFTETLFQTYFHNCLITLLSGPCCCWIEESLMAQWPDNNYVDWTVSCWLKSNKRGDVSCLTGQSLGWLDSLLLTEKPIEYRVLEYSVYWATPFFFIMVEPNIFNYRFVANGVTDISNCLGRSRCLIEY